MKSIILSLLLLATGLTAQHAQYMNVGELRFASGATAWNPLSDTNVIAWYSTSSAYTYGNVLATTNDAPITNWTSLGNLTGETNNLYLLSYAGQEPKYKSTGGPNNLPYINFDGYDNRLTNNASFLNGYTVYFVAKFSPVTSSEFILYFGWHGIRRAGADIAGYGNSQGVPYPVSTNNFQLVRFSETGSTCQIRVNNSTNGSSSVGDSWSPVGLYVYPLTSISDILIIKSVYVMDQNETNIMNYFNAKYNLWTP